MAAKRIDKPRGWYPRRGEVCLFLVDKTRPAVVISSDLLNAHSLDVCIVPISTVERTAFSLRPKVAAGEGGLDRESWIKCDQITTVEKSKATYPPLGSFSLHMLRKIEEAVTQYLELP